MPSLRGGGAERTLINLLHKIDYNRYDVDLVVVSKEGPYVNKIPEQVKVKYFYRSKVLARTLAYFHRVFGVNWFYKKKMSLLDKFYNVGISFLDSHFTDLLFYTDKFEKRTAFVHSSYISHEHYKKFSTNDQIRKKVKRERYLRLDGIYFVSHDSMSDFVEIFGELPNMGVVYNIIDGESVLQKSGRSNSQSSANIKSDCFIFTAVGSLLPVKGFDRLVRASKIVRDKGYKFEVHIAGSGPEKERLQRLIKKLGLDDTVQLHGFVKNPYPLMKRSDVFVMSSVSEALPTVLCEAMILGVPSLVTNCSGCRGLVENGEFGLMAEQNDHDLAEKMMLYMDNPELLKHYSEKALKRAELFDDNRILNSYYKIFEGEEPAPV